MVDGIESCTQVEKSRVALTIFLGSCFQNVGENAGAIHFVKSNCGFTGIIVKRYRNDEDILKLGLRRITIFVLTKKRTFKKKSRAKCGTIFVPFFTIQYSALSFVLQFRNEYATSS